MTSHFIKTLTKKFLIKIRSRKTLKVSNQGQGLVEYLILVALMGIATIAVIRVLNHTITAKFTDAIYALQGSNKKSKKESVNEDLYKKKNLRNFMNGAAGRDRKENE